MTLLATSSPEALLRAMFDRVVAAAQPALFMRGSIERHLAKDLAKAPSRGRTIVVGAGKASGAMAAAFEAAILDRGWPQELEGAVVTRYGYAVPTSRIRLIEAAHPVPDEASFEASRAIFDMLAGVTADDLVVALVSGGGSALLSAPAPGLTPADKQALNRALLRSGAPIEAMNCIRKHLSAIKGGRLARAAAPARLVSLLMSDIPGDEMGAIASGPTLPDPTTLADARSFVARYRIDLSPALMQALDNPANETPKPDDPCFARAEAYLVMTPALAIEAAMPLAREAGYEIVYLGADIEGEAAEVAREQASLALQAKSEGRRVLILSGGETTVTIAPGATPGKGGRNTEYLLALALALGGAPGIHALAGDTDGIDGSEDNAGAMMGPQMLERARAAHIDLDDHLYRHDAYSAFSALGQLLETGPTSTNVNDFRAILVSGA